jgi:hypothetical protein
LPQYRNNDNVVYHKFVAFSVLDKSQTVVPQFVQCNNCGVIHKIYDLCKSEILSGKDELRSVQTTDDFKYSVPKDVREILETYNCDTPDWAHAAYIIEHKQWGEIIVLSKDDLGDEIQGKRLVFVDHDRYKIENFTYTNTIAKEQADGR